MRDIKDTARSRVRIGFDGRVHKHFLGHFAKERFDNEVAILRYLERANCPFVPRVLESDPEELYLVTSNCGAIVDTISQGKAEALFKELEGFGVRHGDPFLRNITYSMKLGRFCLIDFEFAVRLDNGEGLTLAEVGVKQ